MKQTSLLLLFLLLAFSLLFPSSIQGKAKASRPLAHSMRGEMEEVFEEKAWGFAGQKEEVLDGCDDDDDECFERRMMLDAHLDYIYTQQLKP
ncbi:hypothetical protein HPP92_011513 [Vanilla planifolia]|uniref:Phytosulfokine n=1 Tax=Vanilla planifolia TaxID=51239 RepID=A0A835V1V9_VANPL|nr:hypothetical protein HPP92_011513 [Vanilla planifolia]